MDVSRDYVHLTMAFSILSSPGAGCLQRVTMLLPFDPGFKSLFIHRQVENTRRAKQFSKSLRYLCSGFEDNLIHCFRLALRRVSIEIDPLSVRPEHKHLFLWQHVGRRYACLRDEIRTAVAGRA